MKRIGAVLLLLVAGCGEAPQPDVPEPPEQFSFVIIADPHIAGPVEHERRLSVAVKWINENLEAEQIELVFVVGDIGWKRARQEKAREILDRLAVPYVPVLGDNEIESGCEEDFHDVFAPPLARLSKAVRNYRRAPPVAPAAGREIRTLQNLSFDYRGVHFVVLDWKTRDGGESADLHDFPGGTLPWLKQELELCRERPENSVVLLSHLPMHVNFFYRVFTKEEDEAIAVVTKPFDKILFADFAGHYHINWTQPRPDWGYDLFVTDATWDDEITLRVVGVESAKDEVTYTNRLITLE